LINLAAGIGLIFDDVAITSKILRVVPKKRFSSKVDAITKMNPDLESLSSATLISKLNSYEEANRISHDNEGKKSKSIAFSSEHR
ncbi:hypothetical protein ABFV55_27730, partial [Pseudomonas syringae]|uniref:hypothetical protein n=1 Tax=Pseudomonas syringae TaxID=317 RepID=UPI0034D96D3A